jgi:hypothetical protein
MPAHYIGREPGVLDIFAKYSLKIPRIYSNILEYTRICSNILKYTRYFLIGRAWRSYGRAVWVGGRTNNPSQNMRSRKAIPMRVKVACTLYKLVQGVPLLLYSEQFAIGKSMCSGIIRDVVHAVNTEFQSEISFPCGNRLLTIMSNFQDFCGLPTVARTIDGTHIQIRKPYVGPEDYFYFKSAGYTIQMQAIVDRYKRFLDVAVGMPSSTHDSRMLRLTALYGQAEGGTVFDADTSVDIFSPYLLGDSGYPLKPWLMIPYRDGPGRMGNRSILE